MTTYNFYLFTFRNWDETFILLSIYSYFSIFNIYWVPYYIFSFLFYIYIGCRDRDFYFYKYKINLTKILIYFLFNLSINIFYEFLYFHNKKVYLHENIFFLFILLLFSIIYKLKSIIFLFLFCMDFPLNSNFCITCFLYYMFLLIEDMGIISYFFIGFILAYLRDFLIHIYSLYHNLIKHIFLYWYYRPLVINSRLLPIHYFSAFIYINQGLILVDIKNLIIFVIRFLNQFNSGSDLNCGIVLHKTNYLFNERFLIGYNILGGTTLNKTPIFYLSSIIKNKTLTNISFNKGINKRNFYTIPLERIKNKKIYKGGLSTNQYHFINLNIISYNNNNNTSIYYNFLFKINPTFFNPVRFSNDYALGTLDIVWPRDKSKWRNYISENSYEPLLPADIEKELNKFFNELNALNLNANYISIIFKVLVRGKFVRSCSCAQIHNLNNPLDPLLSIFKWIFFVEDIASTISDPYADVNTDDYTLSGKVIFSFKVLYGDGIKERYENSLKKKAEGGKKYLENRSPDSFFKFSQFSLPTRMGVENWPNFKWSLKDKLGKSFYIFKKDAVYNRLDFDLQILNDSSYLVIAKNGSQVLFTLIDKRVDFNDNWDLERIIYMNDKEYKYNLKNGEIKFFTKTNKHNLTINKIKEQPFFEPKILTLDIETRLVEGKHVPLAICIFDGETSSYALFESDEWAPKMVSFLYNNLFLRKYNNYKVYVHNLSNFDVIFILDSISKIGKVKITMRNSKYLKITVKYKFKKAQVREYSISFYDSFLILPNSLKNLSKSFNVETPKSLFPFSFLNKPDFDASYKGEVPDIKYFESLLGPMDSKERLLNYDEYKSKYKDKVWSLKHELYIYCRTDCIALHQIIKNFHKKMHNLFRVDITRYPTLPSIAFAVYRSKFMKDDYSIHKILSNLHYTLKQSYLGGFTESYKPLGKNIKSFDVNSLYPYTMKKFNMPVGKPVYFSGNVFKYVKEPFGFFKVKVNCPKNIDKPTLPLKYKTELGYRTLFPVGTWEGWYFSEEIKDKLQDGYNFEVLEGYLFEKAIIFDEYIGELYKLKTSVNKNDSLYQISKFLLNSLYGRFGLNPESTITEIVSDEESDRMLLQKRNVDIVPLYSGNVLISYEEEDLDDTLNSSDNISVPISAAIAAYSRITMSYYIRKYNKNIYYIDTDGIKIDCDLEDSEVDSKELGKFKYEYEFTHAAFPSPKVYGGLLKDNEKAFDIVKVKGLKKKVSYFDLKHILNKNNFLEFYHEKWFKSIGDSAIYTRDSPYRLSLKESKREFVFDNLGYLIKTLPFVLKDGILVKRNLDCLKYLAPPTTMSCYLDKYKISDNIEKSSNIGYKIKVKDLNKNIFLYFKSIREAARILGIGKSTISRKLIENNYLPVKKRYIFHKNKIK